MPQFEIEHQALFPCPHFTKPSVPLTHFSTQGISLIKDLIKEYSLDVVQAYMGHIQRTAELSVRELMKTVSKDTMVYYCCVVG